MAQTLDYNKNVTSVVPVTIPTFDDDVEIIQKLDDEPNDVGGLTPSELKAKFDEGTVTAQRYINEVLIPTVVASDLTEQNREAAESERVSNETERVSNENARIIAEQARVSAEASRVSAEESRVSAEASRVAAEQARVDSTNGIVAQATAQAAAAKQSADIAVTSASDATVSATNAESSASAASGSATAAGVSAAAASASATAAETARETAVISAANASTSEKAAKTAQAAAEAAVGKTSYIGSNGNWYEWDAGRNAFVDSGVKAQGPTGPQGLQGERGPVGPAGSGAGDMLERVYDPQGKATDIFAYVDEKSANIPVSDTAPEDADFWIDTNEDAVDAYATNAAAQAMADAAEDAANAYTDRKIAAIPAPDVSGQINTHNTDAAAHADIRTAVSNAQATANSKMSTDFSNASAVLAVAKGGTGVTSLSALATALGAAKIETVTRRGTGTAPTNGTSVTFSFVPKIVFVSFTNNSNQMSSGGFYLWGLPAFPFNTQMTSLKNNGSANSILFTGASVSGSTLTVSCYGYDDNAQKQLNDSSYTYTFVAIG